MKRRSFLAAMGIAPVIAQAVVADGGNLQLRPPVNRGVGFGTNVLSTDAHRRWQDIENARLRKLVEDVRLRLLFSTKRTLPRIVRTEYSAMDVPDKLKLSAKASYRNLSSLRRWKRGYRYFREMADYARLCIETKGTFGLPSRFAGISCEDRLAINPMAYGQTAPTKCRGRVAQYSTAVAGELIRL